MRSVSLFEVTEVSGRATASLADESGTLIGTIPKVSLYCTGKLNLDTFRIGGGRRLEIDCN